MAMMNTFLSGGILAMSFAVGLFFLKFWKKSEDRLFAIFAVAFWLLALERVALFLTIDADETQPYVYLFRLTAFVLITIAVIDKNRRSSRSE